MSKREQRWPMWKITVTGIGLVVAAVALFVLASFAGQAGHQSDDDDQPTVMLSLPSFLIMLGVAMSLLAAADFLWLGMRIRESRIPPWERKERRKKRRRR